MAVIVTTAAFVQGLTGFGFTMTAIPFLVISTPVKEAIIISTLIALGISAWQTVREYKNVKIPVAARLSIAALITMPAGIVLFAAAQPSTLRIAVGVAVIAAVVLTMWRPATMSANPKTDIAAGALSGALKTSVGVNGPPIVIACHAHGMNPTQFRATVATVLGASNAVAVAMFAGAGQVTTEMLVTAGLAAPLVLAGVAAGTWALPRVPANRFRLVTLLLTGAAGVGTIVAGVQ